MELLNKGTYSEYFRKGRLVLLSKKIGELVVTLDQTRPIVVNSHMTKIYEKVILSKISQLGSNI
jgi:hypothetical protein